jgi:hypothetical protein
MVDNAAIKAKMQAYVLLGQEIESNKKLREKLKQELLPHVQEQDTNSKGSHVLEFDEPLPIGGSKYKSLQYIPKQSKVLNEERTLEFLKRDQAFECAIVTVEHVDQDALWELFVNDQITQEELDSFFDTTITWALTPTKE